MIKVQKGMTLRVNRDVIVTNQNYNSPKLGKIKAGSIIRVSHTTRLSDLAVHLIGGEGKIEEKTIPLWSPDSTSFGVFLKSGHTTQAPYDLGTLDSTYYTVEGRA